MFGITEYERSNPHHLTAFKAKRQQQDVAHRYTRLNKSTNPVTYDGNELINFHTKYVFDEVIERDTPEMTSKGCHLYTNFKKNWIESDSCSLWDPMKHFISVKCTQDCKNKSFRHHYASEGR